jgi:[ribosomal protein S5]-alanine N-acetyltransferase
MRTGKRMTGLEVKLTTTRLSLAPVVADDALALLAHWREPGVLRYLWDGRQLSPEEVPEIIATSHRLFRAHGAGLWAVRLAGVSAGRGLLGCAGFWPFHDPPELELLLSLSSSHWRWGYGLEAASALLDHAFDDLGWDFVQGSADAPNTASLALMRRLGMQPAGERPGEFGVIEVFRIARLDWRGRRMGRST